MNGRTEEDSQQRSLDALLGHSQLYSNSNSGKFDISGGFEHELPSDQAYPSNTPAAQHEKLLYMNGSANNAIGSTYHSANNPQTDLSASFIDSKTTASGMNDIGFGIDGSRNSISNPQYRGSFAYDSQYNDGGLGSQVASIKDEEMPTTDLFLRPNDESLLSFADDISSSLGSSLQSFDSSFSSSFSYQPQQLNTSAAPQSASAYYSPSVKSPSSSVRAGSYLSTSLRNGSAGTPNMMNTPRTRHASISGNQYADGLLSASVPKSMTVDERLRRKREFHNAVERRRRELIKQKIKELGNIVPPSLLNYDSNGKQVRPNKGIILNKTVEYLEYLLQVLEIQERKKKQLVARIGELQVKETQLQSGHTNEQPKQEHSIAENMETDSSQPGGSVPEPDANFMGDDPCTDERIIDVRSKPHPNGNTEASQRWQSSLNELDSFIPNTDENFPTNDDLQQFLSGDLIEAEDNAKLIFNSTDPPDYLLDFNT